MASCGGSAGLLLGGLLTSAWGWRWIFLVNLPLGFLIHLYLRVLKPSAERRARSARLDIGGATTITASLMLVIASVLNAGTSGWGSVGVLGSLLSAAVLFSLFLSIESRVLVPVVPLTLFTHNNLRVSVCIGALWAAAQSTWFFISALNLQLIFGRDPLKIGLAFLPATLLATVFSVSLAAKLTLRFGSRIPMVIGLVCEATALVLLAYAPLKADFSRDLLPAMSLLGVGVGIIGGPLRLRALTLIRRQDHGVASGVLNGAVVIGAALGLAVTASLASVYSEHLGVAGVVAGEALHRGYGLAYLAGAGMAAGAAVMVGMYSDECGVEALC
jgi:hypothetical protein